MGSDAIKETAAMIAGMDPVLDTKNWCFVSAADQGQAYSLMPRALATFREVEGLSLIVPLDAAQEAGIEASPFSRITLQVQSALDGVGLTAAVSSELAEAGIPCNMVAAFHHDHVFVPTDEAEAALAILKERSRAARGDS